MKKLILLIAIFLVGAMSYSKSDKEEKPNENKKINAPARSPWLRAACRRADP